MPLVMIKREITVYISPKNYLNVATWGQSELRTQVILYHAQSAAK
jgi:hypothetical protein